MIQIHPLSFVHYFRISLFIVAPWHILALQNHAPSSIYIAGVKVLPHCIGTKSGRSFLIEDGALPWIVQNANNEAASVRRHIELALCHLAQHGKY